MALDDDRSGGVKVAMYLFLALTWITFPMRVWVRAKMVKAYGADDILTAITLVVFTVFGAFVLYAAEYGTGRHNASLERDALIKAMMGWWWAETFYILSCFFLKIAFGVFLLRVAQNKRHRMTLWVLIATNILFYIFYFFQSIFQCFPVSHYWNRANPEHKGSCHDPNFTANSTYAQSALSIVTDVTYAIIPIFIVRKLQMSRPKRISLSILLGLGALASIAVIVRIPYVVNLAATHDFLWETTEVVIWSVVEPGLGLFILNIVVTRPLLRVIFSAFGSLTGSAKSRQQGYSSKLSAYRKPSTYGTSTSATRTNNANPACNDVKCVCSCHEPCVCGKDTSTFYEDVTPSEAERGFAHMPTSPKAAHTKTEENGIMRTTEISSSSTPRSLPTALSSHATKSLPNRPVEYTTVVEEEEEDEASLVKPRASRENYSGINMTSIHH